MYTFHKSRQMAESGGRKPVSREGFHRDKSPLFYQVRSLPSKPQSEHSLGTNTIIASRGDTGFFDQNTGHWAEYTLGAQSLSVPSMLFPHRAFGEGDKA